VAFEDLGTTAETRREREFDHARTVALSDGVFAIALTLLILNVDEPTTHGGFWARLSEIAPDVGAYALSFAVLGMLWLRHHVFFRDLRRIDSRTAFLNLVYLGVIAFIPFPTSLLADQGGHSFSVVSYAVTLALAAVTGLAIHLHANRARLVRGLSAEESLFRPISAVVVFAISIPIAFVSPTAAEATWVLLLVSGLVGRRRSLRG
jgi:uncharacterized membrane protein